MAKTQRSPDPPAERTHSPRVYSKDEALLWLRSQPGGRVTATDAELGRQWGRSRSRVGKWMGSWAKADLIKRRNVTVIARVGDTEPGTNGGTNGRVARDTNTDTQRDTNVDVSPDTQRATDIAIVPVPPREVARPTTSASRIVRYALHEPAEPLVPVVEIMSGGSVAESSEFDPARVRIRAPVPSRERRPWVLGSAVFLLGLLGAFVGLVVSARYAASLASTGEDAWLLALLGLIVDGGAVILFAVSVRLWQIRHFVLAPAAFVVWVGASAVSAIGLAGFTSQAIGDHAAGRASVIEASIDVRQQRLERIASTKLAVGAAMMARDQECGKVGPNCRQRVAELNARQSELTAALEAPITASPAVGVADPPAHMLAALLGVSQTSVQRLRIGGLTVAPLLAGLCFAFATGLLGRPRQR